VVLRPHTCIKAQQCQHWRTTITLWCFTQSGYRQYRGQDNPKLEHWCELITHRLLKQNVLMAASNTDLKPMTSSPYLRQCSNFSGVTNSFTSRCFGVGCRYCPNVRMSTPGAHTLKALRPEHAITYIRTHTHHPSSQSKHRHHRQKMPYRGQRAMSPWVHEECRAVKEG